MKKAVFYKVVFLMMILFSSLAFSATTDSIIQYGITWHFDQEYEYGQFVNGDYWVLGPVTITRIEPDYAEIDGRRSNGWEVNPVVGARHGFQEGGYGGGFDASLVPSLPYTTSGIESIVKTIVTDPFPSAPEYGATKVAAVLTVVEDIPPDGGATVFRPPYVAEMKPFYSLNDLRLDLLPRYATVGAPPSYADVSEKFKRLRLDHIEGMPARGVRPRDAMADYQPKNTPDIMEGALSLMLDYPEEAKMPALIQYIQAGIDKIYTINDGQIWPAGPGHEPGHIIMASFTATMLDIGWMKDLLNNADWFHASRYLNTKNRFGKTLWGQTNSEDNYWTFLETGSGAKTMSDPYGYIDGGLLGHYQSITSQSHKGEWLCATLMPVLQDAWPQQEIPLVKDYVERWVNHGMLAQPDPCAPYDGNPANRGITYGPDPNNPGMCILDPRLEYYNSPTDFKYPDGVIGGRFSNQSRPGNEHIQGSGYDGYDKDGGQYRSDFVAAMWDAYYQSVQNNDTESPSVPGNLAGMAISQIEINLTWSASSDNVGVAGYRIYRDGTQVGSSTTTNYSDTGLTAGETYIYAISAYDAAGNESAQCAGVNAETHSGNSMSRPYIVDNTLVNKYGKRLRGGTFWLYGWMTYKTDWALSDGPWIAIKEQGLNAVRLACGYRPERENNYSLDEYESILDALIARAATEDITVVIDYHPAPGGYYNTDPAVYAANRQHAIDFWSRFAPRYKDNENVIYELINEPKFDGPNDYTDELLNDFENLWRLCDDSAPDTPIIILTYCQVGNHPTDPNDRPVVKTAQLDNIDWTKTVVGFHSYWRESSERIVELKNSYPVIDTEFTTYPDGGELKEMDGFAFHASLMESLGISWLQWDIIDREPSLLKLDEVITDLRVRGLYWVEEDPDTESPTVPAGLTASGVYDSRVDLSWAASTDNLRVAGYRIYRDGIVVGLSDEPMFSDSTVNALTLYRYSVSAYDFAGNESASCPAISVSTPDAGSGFVPCAVYNFDFDTTDSSGNGYDGIINGLPVQAPGHTSGAYSFSSGDYISVPWAISPLEGEDQSFTLSAWVRPADLSGCHGIAGDDSPYYHFIFGINEGNLYTHWRYGDNWTQFQLSSSASVASDAWSHVAVVYNAFTRSVNMYINGELAASDFDTRPLGVRDFSTLYIGRGYRGADPEDFSGIIDEVLVYSVALTTAEIADIAGIQVQPDTEAPSVPGGLTGTAESQTEIELIWTSSVDNVGVAGYRVFRDNVYVGVALAPAISYNDTGLSADTTYSYTVAAYDDAGNESAKCEAVNVTTLSDEHQPGIVAYYRFDESAADFSGNEFDGVVNGSPSVVSGMIGNAYEFDGVDDYIEAAWNSPIQGEDQSFTIAAWVNTESTSGNHWIIGDNSPYRRFLFGLSGGELAVRWRYGVSNTDYSLNTGQTIQGDWTHVAVTYDSSDRSVSIYINGSQAIREATTQPLGIRDFNVLQIGRGYSAGDPEYFEGMIDEVRIYDRSLNPSEIQDLYSPSQNTSPVIAPISNVQVYEGEKISFDISVSDQDAMDTITLSLANLPQGANVAQAQPGFWHFEWQTDFSTNQNSPYTITFIANDGSEDSDPVSVSIIVNDVNSNLNLTNKPVWVGMS